MSSVTVWIIASIVFFVSMIMFACGWLITNAAVAGMFCCIGIGMVCAGWILWGIGLVNYIRHRY